MYKSADPLHELATEIDNRINIKSEGLPKHIKVAEEMAKEISSLGLTEQLEVIRCIKEVVLDNLKIANERCHKEMSEMQQAQERLIAASEAIRNA